MTENKDHDNERFRFFYEQSAISYQSLDEGGHLLEVNPAWLELLGCTRDEAMDRYFGDFLTSDSQKLFKENFSRFKTVGEIRGVCLNMVHKDGHIVNIEATGKIAYDDKGHFKQTYCTLYDITDRKQAEEDLRESEERFRKLFEYAPEAYFISDFKGMIIDGNKAAEKLAGYKKEELIGKNILKLRLLPLDQIAKAVKIFAKSAILKPTGHGEIILKRSDNTRITVEVTTFPINIKGKHLILGIARDITERKKYEDKIKYLSFHDNLTGLYNRTYFEEELARLDTDRQLPISIITADLNGLKLVNDTFGHEQGDELLRRSAKLLESCCRADDIIARLGGDEFSILLPKTTGEEADEFINRIKNKCLRTNKNKAPISLALGFSTKVSPDQNIQEIIKKADDYMYMHKQNESSRRGQKI